MNTSTLELNLGESPRLTPMLTFDQVLDIITQWPREQQLALAEVLHQREIAADRHAIAASIAEARRAYRNGELVTEDAPAAITRLRAALGEEA